MIFYRIMKKDKKKIAATCSKMVKNEYFSFMVKWGEILNLNLMELMAEMGSHPKALMAEVYALAKLWAYLRGISEHKGYQVDELFEKLVPMFEDEVKEILKDEESK